MENTYEKEFRKRIQNYNENDRKVICDSMILRELLMQNNFKRLLEKEHNIRALENENIKEYKECWTIEWQNKYGHTNIDHLMYNDDKRKDPVILLEEIQRDNEFKKQNELREDFKEWVKDKNINTYDQENKLIGMRILEIPENKEKFEKWLRIKILADNSKDSNNMVG